MNPKSGKAPSPESPVAPTAPEEADVADPGKVAKIKAEQAKKKQGKYGSTRAGDRDAASQAASSGAAEEAEEPLVHFVSFELKHKDGTAVPDEPYKLKLPDGSIREGRTGPDGKVRIDGLTDGQCEVNFPNIDSDEWRKA